MGLNLAPYPTIVLDIVRKDRPGLFNYYNVNEEEDEEEDEGQAEEKKKRTRRNTEERMLVLTLANHAPT